jgi:HTH-type transcriptional regulator/antitoxin HigA
MPELYAFNPNWLSPPGDTIQDILDEKEWSLDTFSIKMGFTHQQASQLIDGILKINPSHALRLSVVVGSSQDFWLNREAQYREMEAKQNKTLEEGLPLLDELPLSCMIKNKWIVKFKDKLQQVKECFKFFEINSFQEWKEKHESPLAAFRASEKFDKKAGSVAAWLQQAKRASETIACNSYDPSTFSGSLPKLRALTNQTDPKVFVPELQSICARAGVAVVFVPTPKGCPVHGAVRWIAPDRALLALSLRYKSNDHLWFSFFHEVCHIIHHAHQQNFIEGIQGLDQTLEDEANQFSANLLIPPSYLERIKKLKNPEDVENLANEIGIHPGILVGRMQKEKYISFGSLDYLKIRYHWSNEAEKDV